MSAGSLELHPPTLAVTMQEEQLYHMVLDHELDQLSRSGVGVLASIGFTALGTALGLAANFAAALERVLSSNPTPLTVGDLVSVCVFVGSAVIAVFCLALSSLAWWRNKGTAARIRARKRIGVGGTDQTREVRTPTKAASAALHT